MFLATVLEQLDVAVEHILKPDAHNARFGLMLTDNALELVLHKTAKNKEASLKQYAFMLKAYEHQKELEEACGDKFEPKLRFAKIEGLLTEREAQTVAILHSYRNQVYHVGIQHEAILPQLAALYFDTVCTALGRWEPNNIWWSSTQTLPERARKYFPDADASLPGTVDDFSRGCETLAQKCNHDPAATVASLAEYADQVVSDADTSLDAIASGIYPSQRRTRDQAVREIQAWPLALTDRGRKFAEEKGWTYSNTIQLSDLLAMEYPVAFRRDPIPSWRRRVERLHNSKDAHQALANYNAFMRATADLRNALDEVAGQIDDEINLMVDAARGK